MPEEGAGRMPTGATRYQSVVRKARDLVADKHISRAHAGLERYLTSYEGRLFDHPYSRDRNSFTQEDIDRLVHLSVRCSPRFRNWLLRPEGRSSTRPLLRAIPADADIGEVTPEAFDRMLGPASPSWELWTVLYDGLTKYQVNRRAGTAVTAGKLLHGKRSGLIPIYDSRVHRALGVTNRNIWEASWYVMRDEEVRQGLLGLQASVFPEAIGLSLLRVLDIVVWMSLEHR